MLNCLYVSTGNQVNPQKLAALQRVLQSDFLNAVREVYESVYETVDVSGNPELRANATAKVSFVCLHDIHCMLNLKQQSLAQTHFKFIQELCCIKAILFWGRHRSLSLEI